MKPKTSFQGKSIQERAYDAVEESVKVTQCKTNRWAEMAKIPGTILPRMKKKPRNPKVSVAEKDLQSMAEDLCIALGIRFFRIPDKILSFLAFAASPWTRVFVARYFAGAPDLMLFRAITDGKNEVRFVEIKTEAGKIHQSQAKWHSGLNIHVCYGWAETEKAIRGFYESK